MTPRLALLAPLILAATAAAGTVAVDGHTFTVPDGFTVVRAAGPPLVDRPITADFDEKGRLYVADSSGSNDPVQKQLAERPHRILRLEDTDGDGVYDRRTVYADRMMFPEGTMWFAGSLYVAAPPQIWKLTDADDDGVAERREVWFDGKTLTGCANDLHGPYLGPDGWIYWCKGAFAEQTYERPGRSPFVTKASHIFRARPDGTGIEPVMTGGMDNPVDVVFTPSGDRIFTTTFLVHPGGGQRDGLIHALYGGVYGKVHDPIFAPTHRWTGPAVLPPLVHLGPAAPSGLHRYEGDAFGRDHTDNLFAACFNLHKVTRHALAPQGSGLTATTTDFLASDQLDFHPTDVLEDADGSLLVVDTGGWYKLCCPTSQLHKPDVLGAIYRVRKADAPAIADARGLRLDWASPTPAELAARLEDPRPVVRRRAIEAFAHPAPADPTDPRLVVLGGMLRADRVPPAGPLARRNAVWAAGRIDLPAARALVRDAARTDPDAAVRASALHLLSLAKDRDAPPTLAAIVALAPPTERRLAAEALGRIGDATAVPALLGALSTIDPGDGALVHALTYALIEIGDPGATAAGLKADNATAHRAALIALDQMDGGRLDAATVVPFLTAGEPALKEAAWWIAGRHPEWADAVAGLLESRLKAAGSLAEAEAEELRGQLARFAGAPAVQALLARGAAADEAASRRLALGAMGRSGLKAAPEAWASALVTAIKAPESVDDAIAAARALTVPPAGVEALRAALLTIADDAAGPPARRVAALAALPGGLTDPTPARFDFLRAQLGPDAPVAVRTAAADVLARAGLSDAQRTALVEVVRAAGPIEVARLLPAFERTKDPALGRSLVAALAESPAKASLRPETLRPLLDRFGPAVKPDAEALYAALNVDAAAQAENLAKLLAALPAGDVRRGQAVFAGAKAACNTCHAIGYLGGKVGPDLTRIGGVRAGRDLLEAIVYPSASFVRSYEPLLVATADGQTYNGLLKAETSDELVLTVAADREVRLPRADIDELRPGTVSVMPAGLDGQLTPQELADLVAFLRACK
jgi:putative membrane-bound dehydrogenase-like protein